MYVIPLKDLESVHSIIAGLDFFKMLSRLDLCIAIALFVHHDCTMTLHYILSKIEPFDFFFLLCSDHTSTQFNLDLEVRAEKQ